MALLMFVVHVFTWVLRGGSAIDAVRLCSMYLYVMPPFLLCIPLGLCWSCLSLFSVSLSYALVSLCALSSMLCEWRGNSFFWCHLNVAPGSKLCGFTHCYVM